MRFQRDAPLILIGAIAVTVASVTVIADRLFGGMTASVEESQFELMRSILTFNLRGAENRALARAEMIADLPTARATFAARDRAKLLADYGDMFRVQKEKHGVDQAQFHIPPAVSFLRLHSPEAHGDDLTPFRPMVVEVNRDHVARKGFAIARGGPAIFGVVPVLDPAGEYTGSFEFGIDFAGVLDGLKAAYGLDMALYVEEVPLRKFAAGLSGDVLGEQNRLGRYMRVHSTNTALVRELVTATDLAAGKDTHYTRDAFSLPYGVLLTPLRNAAGEPLGMIATVRDFSAWRAASRRTTVWLCLVAVFAIVILAGVVRVVVGGFVLRPLRALDEGFAALASGDRERRVAVDGFCDEVQALARHHERLRTDGAAGREGQ
jgi:methyl-accepting chemotaxis protein